MHILFDHLMHSSQTSSRNKDVWFFFSKIEKDVCCTSSLQRITIFWSIPLFIVFDSHLSAIGFEIKELSMKKRTKMMLLFSDDYLLIQFQIFHFDT